MVGPMITYLLPILIGYTAGRIVHGQRGAVIGAIATMGVVVGSEVPMFLGAMIIAPVAAWLLKKVDRAIEGRVASGFEMLVDNFSLGILGMVMAILGRLGIGPIVGTLVSWLGSGVDFLVQNGLLPLASVFVEPAKVLFLNNAINHGVLTPLGAAESQSLGQSILFMVESNPGPGLGILCAFLLFGPKALRASTPGAIIIHFLGGIHEIYFPYILAKPALILAAIAGGMTGVFVGGVLGAGLVSAASPGSIIAYMAVTPRGGHLAVLASVAAAAVVSFVVAAALLGFRRKGNETVDPATAEAAGAPAVTPGARTASGTSTATRSINGSDVTDLVVACDAGMGSSVMVTGAMKKRLAPHGVEVRHSPVNALPADVELVMCQSGLAERVRAIAPNAVIVTFEQFVGDPAFAQLENAIKNGENIE